jgi:hypothetical protein
MNNKSILILTALTLVIIVAATFSSRSRAPQTVIETPLLNPELKTRVNDVAQIILESNEESVHITREGNNWMVMQADNYPAQFDKVKKLVLDTADMTILAEKTSNPDLYSELGVEDITDENADSTLLSLLDNSGNKLASVIMGDRRGMDSVYVRNAGQDRSYQVKGQPEVSADPKDWIVKELLSVDNERIMEVTIEHADDDTVVLNREQGDDNFTLQTVPDGRKARSEYFTNQPGTFLNDLSIQNAKSQANFTFPEDQVVTTIKTYDGIVATIHSAKIDNINHASMSFSIDETIVQAAESQERGIVIGEDENAPRDVRAEVENLNEKVANWVFIIPQSKYLLLSKRVEELTDVLEEDTGDTQ